ncbi:uncharacterized protein N7511_003668 [Penicillium nucicola]|uniref:uncharacterized protein n=1 Tax=Penicillium nucicola TaxID=1850975 RepID=UPI00254511C5|nr:uncharacterized protein N7511_003668 [Penicillium nucicola]KAJ5766052.1 hypothetical protein N7511_003668 [Penicillium nucicola]
MVFAFTLPTTSPLSFQSFISSSTHPSLPQSASTSRHALRLALKAHKRLPRGPRQDAHLPTVLSALNDYLPYLFAISNGLNGRTVRPDTQAFSPQDGTYAHGAGEEIDITPHAEIESAWKTTLSSSSTLNIGTGNNNPNGKGLRMRSGRVAGRGIQFEIAFTLSTLGYVLSRMARAGVLTALYMLSTPTAEDRTSAVQTATRYLLQASAVHNFLASSPASATAVPDVDAGTQAALSSLALAEATLLAVLKDDAYIVACIQSRNPNDKEWMVHAPAIPKVRALLFARLCVRAAEYSEQASAGLGAVGSASGRTGRVEEDVVRYTSVLGRVARARACRLFGVEAELTGKTGEGIAWLRAAKTSLGIRGTASSEEDTSASGASKGGLSRLKREWTERREERRVAKDAGGSRTEKGALESGDDAGRDEEGRVISMLETKWVKMNDTMNTQIVPSATPLLSNLPSGRDIHSPPAPYQPPSLEEDQLIRMRAPSEERDDLQFGSDDDSDEDAAQPSGGRAPPGGFPDRSATASSVYY